MSRTRKRKANKPVKKGIPVAELGAPFEWTDKRLKIALESYPSKKRLTSKAEMAIVLSLGLYWDDVSEKWQPLSAVDISTVRNQARFYASNPPMLTTDIWESLRLDKYRNLRTSDQFNESFQNDYIITLGSSESRDLTFKKNLIIRIMIEVYDVVGISNSIRIDHLDPTGFPSAVAYTNLLFNAPFRALVNITPSDSLRCFCYTIGASSFKARFYFISLWI